VTLLALVFVNPAHARDPLPIKPKGGYRVTVSGTADLELNLTQRRQCGDNPEDRELVRGVYHSALPPRTETISRALTLQGKRPYGPQGKVTGFSLVRSVDETFDDFTACPEEVGSGGPATRTCQRTRTKSLPTSRHQLGFFHDSRSVLIGMRGPGGDPADGHFPSNFYFCAVPTDFEQGPRPPGAGIGPRIPLSEFTRGKSGTVVISDSYPVSVEVEHAGYPGSSYPPSKYTGKASFELKIEWRRVRRAPAPPTPKRRNTEPRRGGPERSLVRN